MAAPLLSAIAMRGRGWLIAGALAAATLLALALVGEDRQQSLQRHEAAGPLRDVDLTQVRAVRVAAGDRQWRFVRRGDAWVSDDGASAATTSNAGVDVGPRVEAALRLLRNAAPERAFDAEVPEFGLDATALRVGVETGDAGPFELVFGALNPIGLARYTRITHAGRSTTVLLPAYVAEAWRQLADAP